MSEHPYRWIFTGVFTLLTLVAAVGSAVGRWAHDVLLDTDTWLEVVAPISTDPVISDALAEVVSDELIEFLDPTGKLENLLPPLLQPVATRVGEEIESFIREETTAFFHSDLYDQIWLGLNETAHTAAVAIIRDQLPFVSTAGGVVAIDLEALVTPIVDGVIVGLEQLAEVVPDFISDQVEFDSAMAELIREYEEEGLPDRLNNVVVYESDRLAAIQQTVALFDRLVVVLPVMTAVLAILAVITAPSRLAMIPVLILGAGLVWYLSILVTDGIIASILSGIDSDNSTSVAEGLLEGVTVGLDDLLRFLVVAAAVVGAVSLLVVYMVRRREAHQAETELF